MRETNIKAIERWGILAQTLKAIEESNEFGAALSKWLNGYTSDQSESIMDTRLNNLLLEMVDLKLMLDQMEYLFLEIFNNQEVYNKHFDYKLERLKTIINEDYKMTDNKELQYYLVKYTSDWADEMTIEGFALLTNKDKEFFDSITENHLPLTHYVGTNEEIEYKHLNSLLNCYEWILISKLESDFIDTLIGNNYGHFFYPELDEEELL